MINIQNAKCSNPLYAVKKGQFSDEDWLFDIFFLDGKIKMESEVKHMLRTIEKG